MNVFNSLTLKETFFKKLEFCFLVESAKIENVSFYVKLLCQKPMLRQIDWGVQNGPITKKGFSPVTNFFFFESFVSI